MLKSNKGLGEYGSSKNRALRKTIFHIKKKDNVRQNHAEMHRSGFPPSLDRAAGAIGRSAQALRSATPRFTWVLQALGLV